MAAKKVARDEREVLVLRRNYPVAPQAVWRAWIDAAALRIWFGQSDASCWEAELEFTLDPVTDPRESDAWRADFKRLAVLLKEKS